MSRELGKVYVLGAGKVGTGLGRALRRVGVNVKLRPGRKGWPNQRIDADMVIIAVRDGAIAANAAALGRAELLGHRRKSVAVVHCAGSLGPEVLAAARKPRVAVAQMHPLVAFAARDYTPSLKGAQLQINGDPIAVRLARRLGRLLGMTPRTIPDVDLPLYHAAGVITANGATALAWAGATMLVRAGIDVGNAAAMLGPLLRSVAENVERYGLPEALTGPVRRGDFEGVQRHLNILREKNPEWVDLYLQLAQAQLQMAQRLQEAEVADFEALAKVIAGEKNTSS